MIILHHGARSGAMTFGQTDAPSVSSHFPDARSRGIRREGRAAAGAASGRHPRAQPHPACAAVQAGGQRPVSHRDRSAWLRGTGRAFRAGAAALPRLGGTICPNRPRSAAAGQLRLARAGSAVPRQGTRTPRARATGTGGGYQRRAAMAVAAALGGARPHQPGRLGQWRQRPIVGSAAAIAVAGPSAGFPLGHRVLSGLPALLRARLERAGADAAFDRGQGRRLIAARLSPDGRRRPRP